MATNVTVYDLDNYPDNAKTVVVDQTTIVPIGAEGDEKWVAKFTTTAYSDNTNTTSIQDLFVREMKAGWFKSSGLVSGPFTIQSGARDLAVKMDAGSTYYIRLDTSNVTGDTIADDIEAKIRAIPSTGEWNTSDDGYKLAYMNCTADFAENKFKIVSGSMCEHYTGSDRSSVVITASGSDTCYTDLGFNMSVDSQTIAGINISECLLGANYTADTDTLTLGTDISASEGDAMMITDGTNTDYFTAISGTTGVTVKVCTGPLNSYAAIKNSYVTTSGGAKIQILREQDPDNAPVQHHDTVDAVVRHGIMSTANQIDFSS